MPRQRSLDRPGLVKAVAATVVLLALFATPLPRVEGVLLVAGALLISRRLSTRRILGLVDWHLLVLFAALFVVTHAFDMTGLPARLVAALESRGSPLTSPWLLGPLTVRGLQHHRQRAAGRHAAADPAGAEPEPALFPGAWSRRWPATC